MKTTMNMKTMSMSMKTMSLTPTVRMSPGALQGEGEREGRHGGKNEMNPHKWIDGMDPYQGGRTTGLPDVSPSLQVQGQGGSSPEFKNWTMGIRPCHLILNKVSKAIKGKEARPFEN